MPHIHEKIDFTVSIYIVHSNKVLLHIHKKLGRYLPVGGHIELDEDPNIAALREAKEETGLDVVLLNTNLIPYFDDYGGHKQLIVPNFMDRHEVKGVDPYHEHIDHIFIATTESGNFLGEEGVNLKWFDEKELEDGEYNIPSKIVFYAKEALRLTASNK